MKTFLFVFALLLILSVLAADVLAQQITDEQAAIQALARSSCPDVIKNFYLDKDENGNFHLQSGVDVKVKGTLIYAYRLDPTGQQKPGPVLLSCATASTLEKLVVRIIMILYSIIGIVLGYALIKSIIGMMISLDNPQKFQEAVRGFVNPIIYTFGFFISYTVFVFVAVGVLGVGQIKGPGARYEYNLFRQNRIIFDLTFDRHEDVDPDIY